MSRLFFVEGTLFWVELKGSQKETNHLGFPSFRNIPRSSKSMVQNCRTDFELACPQLTALIVAHLGWGLTAGGSLKQGPARKKRKHI